MADIVAAAAFLVIAGAAGIVCLQGLAAFGTPEVRSRPDLRRLLATAFTLAVAVAGLIWLFVSTTVCFLSDAPDCVAHAQEAGSRLGAGAGAIVVVGALVGYGLAARRHRRSPVAAGFAGSFVLLAVAGLAVLVPNGLRDAIASAQGAADLSGLEGRDATVHVATGDATPTYDSSGKLVGATLAVTFVVDQDIELGSDPSRASTMFMVLPPGQIVTPTQITNVVPTTLHAGAPFTFMLAMDLADLPTTHGAWYVSWRFTNAAGQGYDGQAVFFLEASTPAPTVEPQAT